MSADLQGFRKSPGGLSDDMATAMATSRWKAGKGRPSAENAISFARATGDSPIAGLLAAGLLRYDEVNGVVRVAATLSDSATDALLTELGRRLGVHVSVRKGASA